MSVHSFLVFRDESTDVTTQRFRNWLVKFKAQPDPREWMRLAEKLDVRFSPGRKSVDSWLRAIAVHRLKASGYNRMEAENLLNLKRYALNSPTNQWNKLPKIAVKLICQLTIVPLAFGGFPPFQNPGTKLAFPND